MTLAELLPSIQSMTRSDRVRLLHYLAAEMIREEGVEPVVAEASFPIWTPFGAIDAAAGLAQALAQDARTT